MGSSIGVLSRLGDSFKRLEPEKVRQADSNLQQNLLLGTSHAMPYYSVFKYFSEETDSWKNKTRTWGVAFIPNEVEGVSLDWVDGAPGIMAGGKGYIETPEDVKTFSEYAAAMACYVSKMDEVHKSKQEAAAAAQRAREQAEQEAQAKLERQKAYVEFLRSSASNYADKLPAKETSGITDFPSYEKLEPISSVAPSTSPVKLDINGLAKAEVLASYSSGVRQLVISPNITITNPTDKPMAITEVAAEYQAADGSWCPFVLGEGVQATHIGANTPNWRGEYEFGIVGNGTTLNIDSHSTVVIAVQSITQLEGVTNGYDSNNRDRVHHSLPQPFRVRLTFKDEADRTISLTYEAVNPPVYKSRDASYYEGDGKGPVLFVECADTERYEFSTMAVVASKDWNDIPSWTVWRGSGGNGFNIEAFMKAAEDAMAANTTEFLLEDASGDDAKVWAVVDPEAGFVYALKMFVKTSTGSVTEYGLLQLPTGA